MFLEAPRPFRLECDWLNAQAFRWTERDGWFYGIVGGQLIRVRNADGDRIEFDGGASADDVKRYFRLDQDIAAVHNALREADPDHMPGLVERHGHIRVLQQDPWECFVSYICSRNASIDSTKGRITKLADRYGNRLTLDGMTLNSLPSPQRLVEAGEDEMGRLSLGFKNPSITDTIFAVALSIAGGDLDSVEARGWRRWRSGCLLRVHVVSEMDLHALSREPHWSAMGQLGRYAGVGPKIAECVCLFSLGKDEAFPIDRHIRRALTERYGDVPGKTSRYEWARKTFGSNAGYAGQLLFLAQLMENRRQQRDARYASEDSTIVIDGKILYHEPGEHGHDFGDGSSVLHIHEGWDVPHSHRKEDVMAPW